MLATYAASRHRQIVPCCMISSVSHDNVSRLVSDRSMCFATALDKAFENIDCMSAILRCQAKNRFYESTQRLIQPRRVLWYPALTHASNMVLTSNWATYGKDSYWVLNNVWGHGSLVNGIDYTSNLRPLLLRKT